MKPEVESIDVNPHREDDEHRLGVWEHEDEDFVWGPVSDNKKWSKQLDAFKKKGKSIPQHFFSPDFVDSSSAVEASSTGDAIEVNSTGCDTAPKFRAGMWRHVAEVKIPVGLVTPNARLIHSNSTKGRALGLGQLVQTDSKEFPAILVHHIHESYVVCIVYIPND